MSKYPDLFAELARRDWTDEEMEKLAGLNLIRAFRKIEEVRYSTLEIVGIYNIYERNDQMFPSEVFFKRRRKFQITHMRLWITI